MKIKVGISSSLKEKNNTHISKSYINSIISAGAVPFIMANTKNDDVIDSYLDTVDLLLFTGGDDISPLEYNENPINKMGLICPLRDYFEVNLVKKAYKKSIPMMGICRGMQIINVALGGSLYQDIFKQKSDVLGHNSKYCQGAYHHSINVEKDSNFYDIFKKEKMLVNSYHHQAINTLAKGLKVAAKSDDGIIEVIESEYENYIMAVQFHPEDFYLENNPFSLLFENFVNAR